MALSGLGGVALAALRRKRGAKLLVFRPISGILCFKYSTEAQNFLSVFRFQSTGH